MLNPDLIFANIPKMLVVVDIVNSEFGNFSKLTIYQREEYFNRRDYLFIFYTLDELLLMRKLSNCLHYGF